MQYMLLIYGADDTWTDQERKQCYHDSASYARELAAQGKFISTAPLQPVSSSTTLKVRDGKRLVTDGPFAETREQLGGFFLISAANLDEAIAIAEKLPSAKKGTVEIRPVIEVEGIPS